MCSLRVQSPESLTDLAYERLRRAILTGEIKAGRTVSIVSLAAEMGISRSPVRTAIERLVSDGLVVQTASGAVVEAPGLEGLLEALSVRWTLEEMAASVATPHLLADDVSELSAINARFSEAVDDGDISELQKIDLEFHQYISSKTANSLLIELLDRVQARVMLASYSLGHNTDPRPAVHEHANIIKAMAAGEAEKAGRAASQHLKNFADRVTRAVASADEATIGDLSTQHSATGHHTRSATNT